MLVRKDDVLDRQEILPFRDRKLISLLKMIKVFALEAANTLSLVSILEMEARDRIQDHGPTSKLTKDEALETIKSLDSVMDFCKRFDLEKSLARAEQFTRKISGISLLNVVIEAELDGLETSVLEELSNRFCAFIPPEMVKFFEQKSLFGNDVYDAFEDAREEIKDAGNCLASGLNTAAVFHLMRVVELGLRELAVKLKAKTLVKKLKQTKIPIELGTWEEVIHTLESTLDTVRKLPRGPVREKRIETCSELLKEFRSIKDLFRNKVMHTRVAYDAKQAESAFNHVRNFMQKLTESV